MIAAVAGFVAGLVHVFSGPDHLAAIAPFAMRRPRRSWMAGLRWGLGHSAGVGVVGVLSLILRGFISVDFISRFSDRLVGLLLIGVGAWALRSALQIHSHGHAHGGHQHEHLHAHGGNWSHRHTHAAFGIGALHGLAGSSHFLGILPSLALPSNTLVIAYLLSFAFGTVVAMIGFSHLTGLAATRFAVTGWKAYRFMMLACSILAIGVGSVWLAGWSF